jgi:hypothetical protein
MVSRIERHRFECDTETEGALFVFKILILNSNVDVLDLYL